MSQLIPWGILPQILVMIQFTWRLETILVFALSILAALALKNIQSQKLKITAFIIIVALNGITVYNSYNFEQIKVQNIENIDVSYWGTGYEKEYLPEVTIGNIDYYNNRGNDVIVSGNNDTKSTMIENSTPYLEVNIENAKENTVVEFPRIYYLGYNAIFTDKDGNKADLELYMNGNGFIETVVNTDGTIVLEYEGTMLQRIANYVCIITILTIILIIGYSIRKNKKTQ